MEKSPASEPERSGLPRWKKVVLALSASSAVVGLALGQLAGEPARSPAGVDALSQGAGTPSPGSPATASESHPADLSGDVPGDESAPRSTSVFSVTADSRDHSDSSLAGGPIPLVSSAAPGADDGDLPSRASDDPFARTPGRPSTEALAVAEGAHLLQPQGLAPGDSELPRTARGVDSFAPSARGLSGTSIPDETTSSSSHSTADTHLSHTAGPSRSGATGALGLGAQAPWSPLLLKGGLSVFLGFCIGHALRAFLRTAAVLVGLACIGVLALQYYGWIDVDWTAASGFYDRAAARISGELESMQSFLAGVVPSAGLATFGLFTGFRR